MVFALQLYFLISTLRPKFTQFRLGEIWSTYFEKIRVFKADFTFEYISME